MKLETSIADIRPGDGILAAVIEEVLVESTIEVFENTEDYKTFKLIESRPSISEIQKTHLRGPVTEEVLAFESSVDLRKIGPEEPTKLSPVVDSSLVAPSKSEISPIESTGTYDSKNIIQFKTTTLLEPALSASNTTVLFEEFKEVKPKELIEGDVKLYSHEQKVTIIQSDTPEILEHQTQTQSTTIDKTQTQPQIEMQLKPKKTKTFTKIVTTIK
uniref:Uncharacterized protein n=1 Tax=Megaselia scalaris TaxID=36166 RepID=T1GUQ1_MEGSC